MNIDYIAAGGNRHPSAADWAPGLLAFGAGHNVALWDPEDGGRRGIIALLTGHTDIVNAVKIVDAPEVRCIVTGGADKTVRVWTSTSKGASFQQSQCLEDHQGAINTISALAESGVLVTGSADGTLKIWSLLVSEAKLVQTISLKPRYIPLTCALTELEDGAILLATAGTSSSVQLYGCSKGKPIYELQATLTGHEGWIRSLDFAVERHAGSHDLLLASASQDKYIRLWRFYRRPEEAPVDANGFRDLAAIAAKKSLSNKSQQVGEPGHKYNVSFEALLIGHEDWIYTARWAPLNPGNTSPTLLSASADNSIAIWRADESSGVWVCHTRLGEISAQKGSTTATGSTGGFWIGIWQPRGQGIASLGRTGSWRTWIYNSLDDTWQQQLGISGHTKEVQGLAWAPDGSYLLSAGSDQTTRLFAEWKRDGRISWHEVARPQIHGYDLNCVDSLTPNQFISGADEKLLRVFNKPKAIDSLILRLGGGTSSVNHDLPDAADIPVLGLSNKAIAAAADGEIDNSTMEDGIDERGATDPAPAAHNFTLELDHPPFEEHLARHTLWPEHDKLYGHGYEISAVAASHDGSLIATACKASSLNHAVIRIYECQEWREVKPPLTAHSLTVTGLEFSPDNRYLLSVGRDRQWAVFGKDADAKNYSFLSSNPKGHSRMILDCSWAPGEAGPVFATAGRDRSVKLWRLAENNAACVRTIPASASVTAVACDLNAHQSNLRVAYGTETGSISIVGLNTINLEVATSFELDKFLLPTGAVNALCWRPRCTTSDSRDEPREAMRNQLAAANNDTSVRIINVNP